MIRAARSTFFVSGLTMDCAFVQGIGTVWYYVDSNPAMSRMGRRTLGRILADAASVP